MRSKRAHLRRPGLNHSQRAGDVAKKAQADAGMALQKAFKAAPATQTGMGGSGMTEPEPAKE
ncbi:hypothetical protein D7Y27_29335 [Corallococcus sp. AB004]|nr:hypothetical protein D7Y27_29335 [Corallococcus sp. AB004]